MAHTVAAKGLYPIIPGKWYQDPPPESLEFMQQLVPDQAQAIESLHPTALLMLRNTCFTFDNKDWKVLLPFENIVDECHICMSDIGTKSLCGDPKHAICAADFRDFIQNQKPCSFCDKTFEPEKYAACQDAEQQIQEALRHFRLTCQDCKEEVLYNECKAHSKTCKQVPEPRITTADTTPDHEPLEGVLTERDQQLLDELNIPYEHRHLLYDRVRLQEFIDWKVAVELQGAPQGMSLVIGGVNLLEPCSFDGKVQKQGHRYSLNQSGADGSKLAATGDLPYGDGELRKLLKFLTKDEINEAITLERYYGEVKSDREPSAPYAPFAPHPKGSLADIPYNQLLVEQQINEKYQAEREALLAKQSPQPTNPTAADSGAKRKNSAVGQGQGKNSGQKAAAKKFTSSAAQQPAQESRSQATSATNPPVQSRWRGLKCTIL